jgi:hypothetical protein
MEKNGFIITIKDFEVGASPTVHLDSLTQKGGPGAYSVITNADVTTPGILTQGPGLSTLTNGTEGGAITELVNYILDIPVTTDVTYGIAATKLHKISSTTVTNSGGVFPHSITGATAGNSCIEFQGALYYFFNKASGGDIGKYDLNVTFDDDWGSTVPTGAAALQSAPHPVAKKEDIMLFGNGRYVGTYVSTGNTLAPTKLDFGANTEVADVCFHANQWWIAVNSGVTSGTNRANSQIYLYDGSAIQAQLADEVAVGVQKIGFIIPINGIIYVAYQDISGSYILGYISGRRILPLSFFTGSLPTFAQKTLYKNFIAFLSSGLVYVAGAAIPELPFSISQHADGGYTTVGAIAAPFGVPMIASTQSTSFKLAKFSGYDTACTWKSIIIPTTSGRLMGYVDYVIVKTKILGASARCDITLDYNQAATTGGALKQITTTGKRRHVFDKFANPPGGIEDLRVALDWSNGSAANDCGIKMIEIIGHYAER